MRKFGFATVVASGLAAAVIGLAAPAVAAPAGAGSAQETISELQADGYQVYVENPNGVPLDQASVASVRAGHDVVESVWDSVHERRVQRVVAKSVYVVVK
ncbi:hypothetical protein LV457_01215 [Mycobacterium sp. MYCO198283]|uniref:hypothetical protein n=1 Tax=Mycobacterium sp. MYCO198283 TaxID=2883505 RepID=UPI001E602C03|nr:hypothetical protein [Mycobacterium sp. MYCO198283]MCG5430920.1 hypothetical protein [Mycobacterium sp. MYCO198283]